MVLEVLTRAISQEKAMKYIQIRKAKIKLFLLVYDIISDIQKSRLKLGMVIHDYNPSYLRGRDLGGSLRPALAKS
jgi:hypothetical protein